MKVLIKVLLFILLLSCVSFSYAQTLSSSDGTISIDVPNTWYRNTTAPTLGVQQMLVVNKDKDNGIMVLKDLNYILPWNDISDLPPDTIAAFKDEQIQYIFSKYPYAYIELVKQGTAFNKNCVTIFAKIPNKESRCSAMYFYFIKDNRLYTVIGCGIEKTKGIGEVVDSLITLQIK